MATVPIPRVVKLRPLALPVEHGGWSFVLEPVLLAMVVAPSAGGALIGVAAFLGFVARHPLKLALQDAVRARRYPRTRYCWALSAAYLSSGAIALAIAVWMAGPSTLIPFALAAPLGLTQVAYDARNWSRELLPELAGAVAMSSVAAAIAIAGSMDASHALGLAAIVIARSLPAILYVRALLHHRPAAPVILAHLLAIVVVATYSSPLAIAAMTILLARALWGFTHDVPRAQTAGLRELAFGVMTVALVAIGYVA